MPTKIITDKIFIDKVSPSGYLGLIEKDIEKNVQARTSS